MRLNAVYFQKACELHPRFKKRQYFLARVWMFLTFASEIKEHTRKNCEPLRISGSNFLIEKSPFHVWTKELNSRPGIPVLSRIFCVYFEFDVTFSGFLRPEAKIYENRSNDVRFFKSVIFRF